MTCFIEMQIAEHCNQEERTPCYNCSDLIEADEKAIEIKTRQGYEFVCEECVEDFQHMVVM